MRFIAPYIILCLFLLSFTACKDQQPAQAEDQASANSSSSNPSGDKAPEGGKPIHERKVAYTYKAVCQMKCNGYTTAMIKTAIKDGNFKTKKKWLERKPCPFYAVEYQIEEGVTLYLVISSCEETTKVVRVFDSRRKPCDCEQKK